MARTYNVIDADGHILEPVDIWDKYIDPAYRDFPRCEKPFQPEAIIAALADALAG